MHLLPLRPPLRECLDHDASDDFAEQQSEEDEINQIGYETRYAKLVHRASDVARDVEIEHTAYDVLARIVFNVANGFLGVTLQEDETEDICKDQA